MRTDAAEEGCETEGAGSRRFLLHFANFGISWTCEEEVFVWILLFDKYLWWKR